jgi:A/G-specific adenine glycosylase
MPAILSDTPLPAHRPDPAALLAWYDRHRRDLPWRAAPARRPDPYRVWLSEIMLQQTTVATVGPYFDRFVARFPDIHTLAAAPLDDVLHAWQGLGYYARARNLHLCARKIVAAYDGNFPDHPAQLRALPGIGDYTAAAIAAIACDRPVAAVDGNVERVVARLFAERTPLPRGKKRLRTLAASLVPEKRAGDFAQAMMDLGAVICTPRGPRCVLCPWRNDCAAARLGIAEDLPVQAEKPERPTRYGVAFWLTRADGAVLLRRRPERGLLGGMIELPSTDWREAPWDQAEAAAAAPASAEWGALPGTVRHGFTHFRLDLALLAATTAEPIAGIWARPAEFKDHAFPTLTRKLVAHALSALQGCPDQPASNSRVNSSGMLSIG